MPPRSPTRARTRTRTHRPWAAAIIAMVLAAVPFTTDTAHAEGRSHGQRPVTNWARREALPLMTVDPAAPIDDLAPLRRSVGDAVVVGLGESVHGAAEETTLKHRTLRFLVEELGFRTVAWEEDWTTGILVNEYLAGGRGDLEALMRQMSSQWQTREVADVLRWLRQFNEGRSDKVQFFGVEYYATRRLAYDALDAHVARTAPERLVELRSHLSVIRPPTPDIFGYIEQLSQVPDKTPYIEHARQVQALVASLPHPPGDRGHAIAMHHAHQILSFYVHYSLPFADSLVYRDRHAAEHVRWWRELTGDRMAYWAASPHTANAPELRIAVPPEPDLRFPSAGSYLRDWYGERYLSVGFTFDHGTVSLGPGATADLPPPPPTWFEHPLGGVRLAQFALDLRGHAPRPVRQWLDEPLTTRGLADSGPGGHITGGTLRQWFDLIVHRQEITAAEPT